jgi:hypothetical protein
VFAQELLRAIARPARQSLSPRFFGQDDVTRVDFGAGRRHRRTVEHRRELANVAWPRVLEQSREGCAGELFFADVLPQAQEQDASERENVALSSPQGR